MTCERCAQERPVTYRLRGQTICYDCVQGAHPELLGTPGFPEPPENVSGPVHHVGDTDIVDSREQRA